jgi:hypothetical protein
MGSNPPRRCVYECAFHNQCKLTTSYSSSQPPHCFIIGLFNCSFWTADNAMFRLWWNAELHCRVVWGEVSLKGEDETWNIWEEKDHRAVKRRGSDISRKSTHRWWWGCQSDAPAVLSPQKDSWYSFLLEAQSIPGPQSRWKSIKKSNYLIGNRNSDLPACSIVP